MVKAVIFDLDGTLLDRGSTLINFITDQHQRLNITLGHINQREYKARFIELDQHGYVWKDKVYQQLITEFDITGMSWEQMLHDYLVHFPVHCVPFPNLIPMLEELKSSGIRLGMITNGFADFQSSNIRALGIQSYFDVILISENEELRKPDRRIFERALDRLGVEASEAVFIGDHSLSDVEGSAKAGMISVWKRNPHWGDAHAHYSIDELDEIPGLIFNQLAVRKLKR